MAQYKQPAPIIFASFKLEKNGLVPLGTPTFENWLSCGLFMKDAEQSVQFWIGDWLLYGENHFGKTDYEKAIAQTGLNIQTLYIYKHVAAAIPLSLRRKNLSFHHHKEVASLSQETQDTLLNQAEKNRWPVLKLKHEKYRFQLEQARLEVSLLPALSSRLLFGESAAVLSSLPAESLDLVVSAPRFHENTNKTLQIIVRELERCLKMNSHLYFFLNRFEYARVLPFIQPYFTVKNLLVWEKSGVSAPSSLCYTPSYDFILFAHKGRRHLNGSRDASVFRWTAIYPVTDTPSLALLEYLIEKSSQPWEVVCDPFAGGASMCVAAKQKGRKFLGIESDKRLFDLGHQRVQQP